jgi:hypothetical protein
VTAEETGQVKEKRGCDVDEGSRGESEEETAEESWLVTEKEGMRHRRPIQRGNEDVMVEETK